MSPKLILLSVSLLLWLSAGRYHPATSASACRFVALDVGQGDSLLIQTSDHQDILIDGGPDDSAGQKLGQYLPPGDRDIELMVLTHPHADHVNGLVSLTENFTVRQVLLSGVHFYQAAYAAWMKTLDERQVPRHHALVGQSYRVGNATLTVFWPVHDLSTETIAHDDAANGGGVNDSSIVLRLTCGGSTAMLMGDASSDIEERIVESGAEIKSTLLKVGHHGSRFSSSPKFLAAVKPRWAVISDGAGNRYHHPHPTALLHLQNTGATIQRTDLMGDICLQTDGRAGWEKCR